jgi:hypothetical protein
MRTTHLLLLLAATLAVSSCSNDSGPVDSNDGSGGGNTSKGTISGVVSDVMGLPITGASVTTRPASTSAVSDANGRYTLSGVAAGDYVVLASKSGYQSDSLEARVTASAATDVAVTLLEDGLIAAYPFAGNAFDATANGHNGVINGAALTSDRFGAANNAYQFGNSAWIDVPHSPVLNFTGSFSIGAWVKLAGTEANYTGLIAKGPRNTEHPGYMLLIMDGNVFGTATGQPSYLVLTGARDLNDRGWHYVTLVTDASLKQISIYVDGVLEHAERKLDLGLRFDTTEPLHIGVERNMSNFFRGAIDDIRIFDRALTVEEIARLSFL